MDADGKIRWQTLSPLLDRALELTGDERAAWLTSLSQGDPRLAVDLEALLEEADAVGHERFLEDDGVPQPFRASLAGHALVSQIGEDGPPPERVGPYHVLREIGRGGMGRVFLAEQEIEDIVRRVALKILAAPALSEELERRFRAERRILASLEHPGIARFLDAGRSPEGTFYLALEYVNGEDLLAYVASQGLGIDERVHVFLSVLEAVQFAHSRRVVHRDLKPSNILVGADGRPRLLDFGIAKLLATGEEGDTAATRTDLRAWTPGYACPEQVLGLPVTAASDVYSLGVILYELLSGAHPYRAGAATPRELERAVLEEEPRPPSTAARRAVADDIPGPTAPADARQRTRRLRGDLDAIVLKAMRKEPEKRYSDAGALAEDLRRHLDGASVEARHGERRYRIQKFMQRNRLRFAGTALAALAVAAVAFAVVVTLRARPPEAVAGPPSRRTPAPAPPPGASIKELERFFAAAPDSLETGAALARALDARGRPQEALAVVARMRQIPGAANDPLTDYTEAWVAVSIDEPHRALSLATRALDHPRTAQSPDLEMRIRANRARALSMLGRREEARAELERSVDEAERLGDPTALALNLNDLAIEEAQSGELGLAEQHFERALALSRASGERLRGGVILANLAQIAVFNGHPDVAESRVRESVAIYRELDDPRRLGMSLTTLSDVLHELGRPAEVAAPLAEAIGLLREVGEDSSLASALYVRGGVELDQGLLEGVEDLAREIAMAAETSGAASNLAFAEMLRGRAAAARGDAHAARRHFAEARRLLVASGDLDAAAYASLFAAGLGHEARDPLETARLAEEAAAPWRMSRDNEIVFRAETLLAHLAAEAGQTGEAHRRLAALGSDAADRPGIAGRLALLAARAALARVEGRLADARGDLETAIAVARRTLRKVDELGLRLALAGLEADDVSAVATARAIAEEAGRLGLAGIQSRARQLAVERTRTELTSPPQAHGVRSFGISTIESTGMPLASAA